jgi:hypothetical protein
MRGIKAISINPKARSITRIEIGPEVRLLSVQFGEKPRVVARLTRGDALLAGARENAEAFMIGGSRPISGPGLIVGRRTAPGERGPARVALDHVVTMVRWTCIERPPRPEPPAGVRAIVVDPELGLIDEVVIEPNTLAMMHLLGSEIGGYLRVPGEDHVLSPKFGPRLPWHWRKDALTFTARCVIVGHDPQTDYFADAVTSVENLRNSVEFRGPDDKHWIRYADRLVMGAPTHAV